MGRCRCFTQVTQFDTLGNFLLAGNTNGSLTVWDLASPAPLSSRQLFGIITGLQVSPPAPAPELHLLLHNLHLHLNYTCTCSA